MRSLPKTLPPHGHSNRYTYGCRCQPCTKAAIRADQLRRLDRMAGRSRYIPGPPVTAHIHTLLGAGFTRPQIARLSQVPLTSIVRYARGTKFVSRPLGERILAVMPTPGVVDGLALVPALGSTRRVRALYALGHYQHVIAKTAHVDLDTVSSLAGAARTKVEVRVAAAIRGAYDELSMSVGTSAKTRLRAKREGWAPPLAWDEDAIDNPQAQPHLGAPEPAEDYVDGAAVHRYLTDPGVTVTDAERLAAIVEAVRRGLRFSDLDDLHRLPHGTTQKWIDARRRRAERHGEDFPVFVRAGESRKLCRDEVVAIRQRAAAGETYVQLALAFGIATSTVSRVVRGVAYAEHGGPITRKPTTQPSVSSRLLFNGGQAAFLKAS
ncbi:helix-turn-helix domain-containing protein [Streptomyces sp. NPDC059740]|uniref:helix-turn-helix domain-containing protein n=1 Tax=Streptomyces sp. NPDC059740 TaxID=3346926 RepID=UPI003665DEBB